MLPSIPSIVSKYIGYFILAISGIVYTIELINESSTIVLTLGLSAFGILGVLSAICFTFVPCLNEDNEKKETLYAGEKFLHSCLLIIQSIFFKYASEHILAFNYLHNISWLLNITKFISYLLLLTLVGYALWFSLYGFEAINNFLWDRYENRVKMRVSKKK